MSACRIELWTFKNAGYAIDRATRAGVPREFFVPRRHAVLSRHAGSGSVLLLVGSSGSSLASVTVYYESTHEIGLWVSPQYRGAGMGRAAFGSAIAMIGRTGNPHVVYAATDGSSCPMARILMHHGFRVIVAAPDNPTFWVYRF